MNGAEKIIDTGGIYLASTPQPSIVVSDGCRGLPWIGGLWSTPAAVLRGRELSTLAEEVWCMRRRTIPGATRITGLRVTAVTQSKRAVRRKVLPPPLRGA